MRHSVLRYTGADPSTSRLRRAFFYCRKTASEKEEINIGRTGELDEMATCRSSFSSLTEKHRWHKITTRAFPAVAYRRRMTAINAKIPRSETNAAHTCARDE
jgi:hypothetical protein